MKGELHPDIVVLLRRAASLDEAKMLTKMLNRSVREHDLESQVAKLQDEVRRLHALLQQTKLHRDKFVFEVLFPDRPDLQEKARARVIEAARARTLDRSKR